MSEDTKKAPAIRFQGFTDDWEQRKLGEVFFQTSKYVNPKESNLELWSLTVENGLTPKTERYNREFLVKKEDQFKSVDHNEFIYNPMNMTLGAVDLNLTGKTVAVSGYYITMLSKDGFDSKYFSIWLKSPLAIKMYKLYATGSLIERQRVQFPTLSQIKSSVPQIEEQTKIGSFFKQLDDTIALHQRKLVLLKQLKQTYLQVMFPQNGENSPALRLDGFSEPWGQRKLIEMANFRRGSFPQPYGDKKWYDETNGMPFVQVVDVGNNLRLVNNTKQKISKLAQPKSVFVEAGKVVVTLQGSIGRVAITQYPSYVDRTLLIFERYKQPIDEYYFAYVIQQLFEIEKRTAPGGTIKTITKEVLSDFLIHIPEIDEQQTLGKYFRKLDDTIALHQQKVTYLQSLKSTLLNKMFI